MLLYGIIILIAIAIITVLNTFLNPMGYAWHYYLIATLIFTVAVILVDAVVAILIRKLPEKHFSPDKKFFVAGPKESSFYRHIGVKKWKDHIPELGGFTDFHKNKVRDPKNNEYLARFMLEACYGVMIHFVSIFVGFIILCIDYRMFLGTSNLWLTIAIPVACVNAVLNYMPVCVLKFNIPKLKAVYKLNARKQKIE